MVLLVATLAGLGAVARVRLGDALGGAPRATLLLNLGGAFALGVLTGAGVTGDAALLVGTAVLGSFTTFSTWMSEEDRLLRGDRDAGMPPDPAAAARLLVLATAGGGLALALGWALGSLAP